MKKKTISIMFSFAAAAMIITGCGSQEPAESTQVEETETEEAAVIYSTDELLGTLDYKLDDYVQLNDWGEFTATIDESDYEVTDEKIHDKLDDALTYFTFTESTGDKKVEEGDLLDISYTVTNPDKSGDDSIIQQEDHKLIRAGGDEEDEYTDSFLWRDELIGVKTGKKTVIKQSADDAAVSYLGLDENAGIENLVYTVTVNDIVKILPTPTHENFDTDMFGNCQLLVEYYGDYDTFMESIKERVEDDMSSARDAVLEEEVFGELRKASTKLEVPDSVMDEINSALDQMKKMAEEYGVSVENIIKQYTGDDSEEAYIASQKEYYENMLLLMGVIEKEQLFVTSNELDSYYADDMTGYDDPAQYYADNFPDQTVEQVALDYLINRTYSDLMDSVEVN